MGWGTLELWVLGGGLQRAPLPVVSQWLWAWSAGLNTARKEQCMSSCLPHSGFPSAVSFIGYRGRRDLKPFTATTALLGPEPRGPPSPAWRDWTFPAVQHSALHGSDISLLPFSSFVGLIDSICLPNCHSRFWRGKQCSCLKSSSICWRMCNFGSRPIAQS